jgi:hypothetical protein
MKPLAKINLKPAFVILAFSVSEKAVHIVKDRPLKLP